MVTAVGPGVNDRKVGDVVAYAGNPMGSYTEEQILPADKVVPVPPSVDPTIAASVILKGMTAQFLVRRCYKVGLVSKYLFADVRFKVHMFRLYVFEDSYELLRLSCMDVHCAVYLRKAIGAI